jgi:hypothetical protein
MRWFGRRRSELEQENAELRRQLALAGLLVWYYRAAAGSRPAPSAARRRYRWRSELRPVPKKFDHPTEVMQR